MRPLLLAAAFLLATTPSMAGPGGHSHVDAFGDGRGASCERGNASFCPPSSTVPTASGTLTPAPGPFGIAGAAVAFLVARRIRARIRS